MGEVDRPPLLRCVKEYPAMEDWLKKIGMHEYYQNFIDAGYETLEYVIMQVGFADIPFNERFLKDELFISNEKHRKEIMKHLNHRKSSSFLRIPLTLSPSLVHKTTINVATPRRPREGAYCGGGGAGIFQYFKKYVPL